MNQKAQTMIVDPIVKRAMSISSSVTFGPGKKEFFVALVRAAINSHCPYCGVMLTLDTMSLDHKIPFGETKWRQNKLLQKALNKPENFQIIDKKCNTIKGNLSHDLFKRLMDFLNKNENYVLKEYIYKKLVQSSLMWSFRSKKVLS